MKVLLSILSLIVSISLFSQSREEIEKKADAFFEKEQFTEALREYMIGLNSYPNDSSFLLQKAICLDRLDELVDSYEAYSDLLKKHPRNFIGYNNRGLLLLRAQEFEMALQDLNKAVEIAYTDSILVSALVNRGSVKFHTRDFNGTYEDLTRALKLDPNNIAVLNNLAGVCDEIGKPELTFAYLRRILAEEPENIGATSNLGFAYQEHGRYDSAIYFFNKTIALDSTMALGYSNRGYCYYKTGKTDQALIDVDRSLELYPTNAYAYRTRALIHIKMGKNAEACKDIEMALLYKFTITYGDEVEELKKKYCQ